MARARLVSFDRSRGQVAGFLVGRRPLEGCRATPPPARLDTDIMFGINNGLRTCLVLSGVTSEAKLLADENEIEPTFYADDINDFVKGV